ncbi:hypothetical protein, partial [Gemella sp. zg-1178]|uniref:hypothetical protein n=1 Tax=Gemella sp. zg-1178 TaxID=2840372 RepID=UPI001C051482
NQFKTPEDYYQNIELSVSNINKKVNSGWYEFKANKGIVEKYQSRDLNNLEINFYWWGIEVKMYDKETVHDLANILTILTYPSAAISIFASIASGGLGIFLTFAPIKLGWIAHNISITAEEKGNCKLKTFHWGTWETSGVYE